MKCRFLDILLLQFLASIVCLSQDCIVPHFMQNGGFNIHFEKNNFSHSEYINEVGYLKAPKTSTDVLNADFITCKGMKIRGAKIIDIKVTDIQGLPKGFKWSCNTDNCTWLNDEAGCVTLEGQSDEIGEFPIKILCEGTGTKWGFKGTQYCVIEDVLILE